MSKQAHGLSNYLGKKFVSSLSIPERRKSPQELAAMTHDARLRYEIDHPPTDEEQYAELERKMRDLDYDMTGEVDPRDLLDNEPPVSWGR